MASTERTEAFVFCSSNGCILANSFSHDIAGPSHAIFKYWSLCVDISIVLIGCFVNELCVLESVAVVSSLISMWFLLNPLNLVFEFLVYFVVDNITKVIVVHNAPANRVDILMYECLCLGFVIGFISYYHDPPLLLICLLCVHLLGTLHSANGFRRLVLFFFGAVRRCLLGIYQSIPKISLAQPVKKTSKTKSIPQEYLYNYHLKPTNDLRLQQSSFSQSLPRPGILNLYGTTCSLNALLQSLASLDRFHTSLKRNVNLSRFKYDPSVSTFIELLSQLQNDQRASGNKNWHPLVDTSAFITQLNRIHPNLLTKMTTTDICELFQAIIDVLNQGLSKQQSSMYATSVIEQVQNRKLTTLSIEHLNRLFIETEAQLHETVTLDNLDAQSSSIVQYVDLTWLLHHIQDGSIVKHCFSGQILHAHCCTSCSHVRFRTEPFQILPLQISSTGDTLAHVISQFTSIETIHSITCSHCSNGTAAGDPSTDGRANQHGNVLTSIASTLSPIVTNRRQPSGQILSSTPISSPPAFIALNRRKQASSAMKSQTMIANFPEILCIQLKRYSYDRLSQRAMKLNTSIRIEPEKILDLSSAHYSTWLGLAQGLSPYRYRLNAVCLHLSGNSSAALSTSSLLQLDSTNGHSVCLYRSDHQRWFLSDDERITEVIHVDHFFQSAYVTENCYLLFYERC